MSPGLIIIFSCCIILLVWGLKCKMTLPSFVNYFNWSKCFHDYPMPLSCLDGIAATLVAQTQGTTLPWLSPFDFEDSTQQHHSITSTGHPAFCSAVCSSGGICLTKRGAGPRCFPCWWPVCPVAFPRSPCSPTLGCGTRWAWRRCRLSASAPLSAEWAAWIFPKR